MLAASAIVPEFDRSFPAGGRLVHGFLDFLVGNHRSPPAELGGVSGGRMEKATVQFTASVAVSPTHLVAGFPGIARDRQ